MHLHPCLFFETINEFKKNSSVSTLHEQNDFGNKPMKKLYITLLLLAAVGITTFAQPSFPNTLSGIINQGKSGNSYTIKDNLVGVYVPPRYKNVLFAKDYNNYANPSTPAEGQPLYDERDGHKFDQSNWVKIVFPDGSDVSSLAGTVIPGMTISGKVNVEQVPCYPLGLTIHCNSVPAAGEAYNYVPNSYTPPNFVMQDTWFYVKPKNLEFALVNWAIYNQADKRFYVAKPGPGVNTASISGRFDVNMQLWEAGGNPDPNTIFQDQMQYDELPVIIEFRLGQDFGLRIDPGYGDDNNIHYAPRRATPYVEGECVQPYVIINEQTYLYTVMVYPLRIDTPPVVVAVDDIKTNTQVVNTTYYNIQGQSSSEPFDGMNIVVTSYSDGSTTTRKMVK